MRRWGSKRPITLKPNLPSHTQVRSRSFGKSRSKSDWSNPCKDNKTFSRNRACVGRGRRRSETPATVGLDDNTLTSVDPLAHLQTRAFSCLVFPMGHEDLGRVFRPEDAGDGYAFLQKIVCESH